MATNNAVNTSLSGQTGTAAFVGSESAVFVTPNVGVATATSIQFTNGIVGTPTNNNADTGVVGEYMYAERTAANGLILAPNTPTALASLTLTPGDWDVYGSVAAASGTAGRQIQGWIGTNTSSLDLSLTVSTYFANNSLSCPMARFTTNTSLTVYLICVMVSGTFSGCGIMWARRVR